jgi:hypothetical protein
MPARKDIGSADRQTDTNTLISNNSHTPTGRQQQHQHGKDNRRLDACRELADSRIRSNNWTELDRTGQNLVYDDRVQCRGGT